MLGLHVVVGLGASGYSCVRYLKHKKVPVAVVDTRDQPPYLSALQSNYPDVPLSLGSLDETWLANAARIVLSPGISIHDTVIAKYARRGVPVIGDIELFAETVDAPVIAITGTNAKSTVTTLVAKMAAEAGLQAQVGGNLGVPALDLLYQHPHTDVYVLELSSFQLETTYSLKAAVATILNVTPDHMDRYRDLQDYQQAKQRVYQLCKTAVCNRDDPLTDVEMKSKVYFTLNTPQAGEFGLKAINGTTFLAYGDEKLLAVSDMPVLGRHYYANALAALALGHSFGLCFDPMLKVLREFTGLPHRCQLVRERKGVRWYNDSKGTNVGATLAAIEGLGADISGKIILIAGGVGKKADFTTLKPVIEKYVRHVVLIGEAAHDIAAALSNTIAKSFAGSMQEAVKQAGEAALPQDCVLLSPACASFDMFKNYEHRGDVFTQIVEQMDVLLESTREV